MERAMAGGSKPWNRSKIMLVGEGRVGKTALCNSMMGNRFVETESTVGFTRQVFEVRTSAGEVEKRWTEYKKPEKECETGIAQLIIDDLNSKSYVNLRSENEINSFKEENSDEEFPEEEVENKNRVDNNTISVDIAKESSILGINRKENNSDVKNIQPVGGNEETIKESNTRNNANIRNIPASTVDTGMVLKCIANIKSLTSDLILAIFDFGGQSVFNIIHHLFLTSYGVYVVLFNMVDILDDNKREQSLNELSFWINSIVIHTLEAETGKVAPMFLVGSHKDVVGDPEKHKEISDAIEKKFKYNAAWNYIEENDELCFLPVNNLEGQQDDVIMALMCKIENNLKRSSYVSEPRPLTWLKALDELMATKKSYLTFNEASSIALDNGVEKDAIPLFLRFLNDMGMVLWLNEDGLRDVVILDIITSFVEPATRIICNHTSKPTEKTIQNTKIQNHFKKKRNAEWDLMTLRGVVEKRLLIEILQFRDDAEDLKYDTGIVVNMMLKYGLIVTLEQAQDHSNHIEQESNAMYLVPSLLPNVICHPCVVNDQNWIAMQQIRSCYYIFCTDKKYLSKDKVDSRALKSQGFLPRGFMERLIGKAVKWSQLTNIACIFDDEYLYQNYAHLSYGNQRFRLVCIPEINCIRLDVEGEHPPPIHDRISEQINICIKECMGSLYFGSFLRLDDMEELDERFTLVNLEAVRKDKYCIRYEGRLLDRKMFSSWVTSIETLPSYDVFISHRWDDNDDIVTKMLYDNFLGNYSIGCEYRAVQVFYDDVRMRGGHQLQKVFGKALINSTVFVPIVCYSALQRMLTHDPQQVDNLLIEWMLALECMQYPTHSKVRGICPLIFGGKSEGECVSPFDASIKDRLPDTIPTKSIEIVKSLLEENGVQQSTKLDSLTVRSVYEELLKYLGELPKKRFQLRKSHSTHQKKYCVQLVEVG